MTTAIQFAPATNNTAASPLTPVVPTKSMFNDMTLKPEYSARRIKFSAGENWLRIVPALANSRFDYMMAVQMLAFEGGRFAHPKTLEPGARSVFDHAYLWAKQHCPEALYSKANKENGVRLLADPLLQCWVIVEDDGRPALRLLQASGYDGSRGGTAGLGSRIWKEIKDHDESGSSIPDAIDPEKGARICIEQTIVKGNPRPIYNIRIGRQPAPIVPMIEAMDEADQSALVPLENTVRRLSEEEEWACLAKVIAPETVQKIRADLGR